VNKYNDLLIHKILPTNEIFYITMDTNATNIEHVENWLQDLKFHHRKYIVIRAIIMVPIYIYIYKSCQWNFCCHKLTYI